MMYVPSRMSSRVGHKPSHVLAVRGVPYTSRCPPIWELRPPRGVVFPSVVNMLLWWGGWGKTGGPVWPRWINQLVMCWLGSSGGDLVGTASVPRLPSHTRVLKRILPYYP